MGTDDEMTPLMQNIIAIYAERLEAEGGDPGSPPNPMIVLSGKQLQAGLPLQSEHDISTALRTLVEQDLLSRTSDALPLPAFAEQEWKLNPTAYKFMPGT